MQQRPPVVTVVIPCYNGEKFLRETLESVRRQTHPVEEVILVDDGSTDASASIAETFAPLVRVIRQENAGESVARNRGIALARGDWVALLDADDIWAPTKIAEQIASLRDDDGTCCCCFTDIYRFDSDNLIENVLTEDVFAQPNARVAMLFDWCVQASSAMIRTDVARRVGFAEGVRFGEDTLFFARVRDHGNFRRVSQPLTGYRRSVSQQTHSERRFLETVREKHRWFQQNLIDYSDDERTYFFDRLRGELQTFHERAYWRRQVSLVREYRRQYEEWFPMAEPPESFRRLLFPRWVYLLKDRF